MAPYVPPLGTQLLQSYKITGINHKKESYLELQSDANLHEPWVLHDGVGNPALHTVAHALLSLAGHAQLQQPVVRAGDGLEEVGYGVRRDPVVLHAEGLEAAVLVQGRTQGLDGEVTDLDK